MDQSIRAQNFDLTAAEAAGYRRSGGAFLLQAVFVICFLVGLVGLVFSVPVFLHDLTDAPADLKAYVQPFIVFGALLAWTASVATLIVLLRLHGGRSPVGLEVKPSGFTFRWKDGCARTWEWTSLRRRVLIQEVKSADIGVSAVLQLPKISWASLTKESMRAILESAQGAGMNVQEREIPASGFQLGSRNYVITRPSRRHST